MKSREEIADQVLDDADIRSEKLRDDLRGLVLWSMLRYRNAVWDELESLREEAKESFECGELRHAYNEAINRITES